MRHYISDYSNYDYKKEFWSNKNRQYEHYLESTVIHHLLKKYCSTMNSIIDAGCGFGRLFDSYKTIFNNYTLIDYSENLLTQAKKELQKYNHITFYKQSLYELTISKKTEVIISIRTLHHLNDIDCLLTQFNKALHLNGILLLDIPNKNHIKNRLKYIFKRDSTFKNKKEIKKSDGYYIYNPTYIINKLTSHGFKVLEKYQIGLFRIPFIKFLFPKKILVFIEKLINACLNTYNYSPSVYVIAQKIGDNSVDNHKFQAKSVKHFVENKLK